MTRIGIIGAGASRASEIAALLLLDHPDLEVVCLNEAPLRLPSLSEFPVNKPHRGKVNTRTDYPGLSDEQRAWNQAVDKRKAEKAARRALPTPSQEGQP